MNDRVNYRLAPSDIFMFDDDVCLVIINRTIDNVLYLCIKSDGFVRCIEKNVKTVYSFEKFGPRLRILPFA